MKRYIYIAFFLSAFGTVSYGQTFNAYMNAAQEAYSKNKFYSAYSYLQEAYQFDTTRLDILYQSAEMIRNYSAFEVAADLYQKVVDRDTDNMFPASSYWLAEMLQRQGKYQAAISKFDLYLSEHDGEDAYLTEKAQKEKKACEVALERIKNPDTSVTLKRADNINTIYSEVGGIEKDGVLYFSSMKFPHPNPDNIRSPKYLSKILKSENGGEGNIVEGINEDLLITAHTTFSNKTNKVYYTICDYGPIDEKIKCDLYSRDVNPSGTYGNPQKLPDFINSATNTTTHPAIGFDKETNKEILYFVSDRPGGKGKFDIWYSVIDDNLNFTQPKNLEDINTAEDDVTPFFHIPSNTLYFSSNGMQGMGGYDIYRAEKLNGKYAEVETLDYPVNSSFDDLYYTLSNDMLKGYLSSNRDGSSYIEDIVSACCFDIYEAKYEPVNVALNALTCEEIAGNQRSLNGATVVLLNARNNEVIDSITNFDGDKHEFELQRNKEYLIVAKKEHYLPDTVHLSTYKIYKSKTFTKNICLLAKTLDLDVFTFDDLTLAELEGVTIVLENLTDRTITSITVTNDMSNDFVFKVKEAHQYKITASRENYITQSVTLDTDIADIIEGRIRQDIFLPFGQMYLPLSLYFDNDKPDSRSLRRTTNSIYSDSYNEYYARKSEYMEKTDNAEKIDSFFEMEVRKGFETFEVFMRGIQRALDGGKKIEIVIRGYASPRSSSAYNLYLGQRRVQNVKNELSQYMDGIFEQYIKDGQLVITEISFGDKLAPKDVSDSITDEVLSIYSYEASKERRVEIIDANQIQN